MVKMHCTVLFAFFTSVLVITTALTLLLSRLRWRRFESYSSPRLSSRREDDW